MSRVLRFPFIRMALAVVLVALSIGGTVFALQGTSGAATTYPPVDHQLCYTATATGFKPPPAGSVRVIDQFAANGFVPKIGPLTLNCNPVQKTVTLATGGKKTTIITNPNAHLACFSITAPTQPTHVVRVTNQFGTGTLNVGQPKLLCLPTWKSLTGPPKEPTNQPPRLNHFTCYSVTYVPGTPPYKVPGPVSLQDEFAPAPVNVTVGAPQLLCLPTQKLVTIGTLTKNYPIINPVKHLLCFVVSKTPIRTPVFDLNQFGHGTVNITASKYLCLPSNKTVLK